MDKRTTDLFGAIAQLPPGDAAGRERAYSPYPIDWRFLPEPVLIVKDFVRYHTVALNNRVANSPLLRPAWVRAVGWRTVRAVERAGVLFIHVPKTAGTAISRCLYGRNLPHYTAAFYRDTFPKIYARTPSFAVIRNPVERFVSAYRFLVQGGSAIIASSRYDPLGARRFGSVDAFAQFVIAGGQGGARFAPFRGQADFVLGEANELLVDRVFLLDREHGLAPALAHCIGTMPPRINATRPERDELSAASRAGLRAFYARDFALFERLRAQGGELARGAWEA